jgi:flagellar motor switch protein FliM
MKDLTKLAHPLELLVTLLHVKLGKETELVSPVFPVVILEGPRDFIAFRSRSPSRMTKEEWATTVN